MNERTSYEQTINEKLQHLPLPAMEDAIWARVKAQLDIDLPSDDNGGNRPDAPSGGGWIWGAGVLLFVAAFVAVFLLLKKPKQQLPSVSNSPQPTAVPSAPTTPEQPDRGRVVGRKAFSPATRLDPGSAPALPVNPAGDSVALAPETRLPEADPPQPTTVLLPPLQVDTTRAKPKTRGVPGITDNDYRIVPARKDS